MPPRTLFAIPADSLSWAGLLHTLRQCPDFAVIGQASDPAQAIEQVSRLTPAVILLALQRDGAATAPVVAELRAVSPASRVVVIAEAVAEGAELARLAAARPHAHLLCGEMTPEALHSALRLIADRDLRMVSGPVLDAFVAEYERLRTLDGRVDLSERQQEVIALLAAGLTQKAIAARLGIELTTVGTYLSRVREKLGIGAGDDLLAAARRRGLLPSADRPHRQ